MNISVALPTRGLIFARTLKSLRTNGINLNKVYAVDGLLIPEAHNEAVKLSLADKPDRVLMVEDDMALPDNTLEKMCQTESDIVYCDYPIDNGCSTICAVGGEIYWGGLGCTLIKREVLEKIGYPYFTCNHSWIIEKKSPFTIVRSANKSKYGGHDINFGLQARELGFKLAKIELEANHLRCRQLQRSQENDGRYEVYNLENIKNYQNY